MTGWGDASALLAASGVTEDENYYREFTKPDEKAVLTVAMRIQDAWARNDPDVFADVFTENGSLLMQDRQLTSREQIREYMAEGFQGPLRGARVKGWPVALKFLDDNSAMAVTEGGIILDGEQDIAPSRRIRATWIMVKDDAGNLRLLSHQSSPVKG
jgi:uncharacterized protein (TIGR02246 family)